MGPGDTVGPIGPFPSGVTGKIGFITSGVVTTSTGAYVETKVHVTDVASATDQVIYTFRDVQVLGLTWAPDDNHLVLHTLTDPLGNANHQLQLLSVTGGGPTVIFDGNGPETGPSYAPDGRLAYWGGYSGTPTGGIWIDGQSVHPLAFGLSGLSWMPAGDALVFTQDPVGLQRLVLSSGSVTTLLTPENGEALYQPAVSPDGSRIALMRFGGSRQGQEIWTVAADGSDPRQLTSGFTDDSPQWTPDGNYVAFTRTGGIHLIPSGGGSPVRVVGVGNSLMCMAWSQ
jgi:Tol biopolymer transport system component